MLELPEPPWLNPSAPTWSNLMTFWAVRLALAWLPSLPSLSLCFDFSCLVCFCVYVFCSHVLVLSCSCLVLCVPLLRGDSVRVLSLRSSVTHCFVTEPWYYRHVLFSNGHAASSVLEPFALSSACLVSCWSMVFGSRHSCLEFRFCVGVRTLALHVLSPRSASSIHPTQTAAGWS